MNRKQRDFEKRKKQVINAVNYFLMELKKSDDLNLTIDFEDMGVKVKVKTHMHSKYIK